MTRAIVNVLNSGRMGVICHIEGDNGTKYFVRKADSRVDWITVIGIGSMQLNQRDCKADIEYDTDEKGFHHIKKIHDLSWT